jgi:predicted ribosome quality control (RQC) complex YloA/Tae2 family protein
MTNETAIQEMIYMVNNDKIDDFLKFANKQTLGPKNLKWETDENGNVISYYSIDDFANIDDALSFVLDTYIPKLQDKIDSAEDTADSYKEKYEEALANAEYYKELAEALSAEIEKGDNTQNNPEQNPEDDNSNVSDEENPNKNPGQSDKEDLVPRS